MCLALRQAPCPNDMTSFAQQTNWNFRQCTRSYKVKIAPKALACVHNAASGVVAAMTAQRIGDFACIFGL